jgi:hypothetical protein
VVLEARRASELEPRRVALKKTLDNVWLETVSGQLLKLAIRSGYATFPQDGGSYDALHAVVDKMVDCRNSEQMLDPRVGIRKGHLYGPSLPGSLELVDGGTLFLANVDHLPPALQRRQSRSGSPVDTPVECAVRT